MQPKQGKHPNKSLYVAFNKIYTRNHLALVNRKLSRNAYTVM